MFRRDGIVWTEETKLTASDGAAYDAFGTSVSVSGGNVLVGAYFDDNENGYDAGATYVYAGFDANVCNDYTNFLTRCGPGTTVNARVVLHNNIAHSGETVLFQIDSTIYPATIVDNGVSSRASISISGLGSGSHTISVDDPAGCFAPRVVTCSNGSDESDLEWDQEETRWGRETEAEGFFPSAAATLLGNYPNPFNPSTTIHYLLAEETRVSVRVFNMLGQEVATLISGIQRAGEQSVVWHGTNDFGQAVSSGLYVYRIQAGGLVLTGKMILLH